MMKKLMSLLLTAILAVTAIGCCMAEAAEEAAYEAADLVGTWAFASAVLSDGTTLDPIEYAAANEIPEEVLAEGIVLVMKLAFDADGNVTESVNDEYFYNGAYTFDGQMVSIAMEDGRTMEAEMSDVMISEEMTATLAITDADVVFLYGKISDEAQTAEASYEADDLVGTWAFACAVMEDGTSMDPTEFAKALDIPEEVLTAGVLVMKLAFDADGNVTESVNDEYFYSGAYTFDGSMASIAMEDGRTMEAEMSDIIIAGVMTTTLAIADTGVVYVYGRID